LIGLDSLLSHRSRKSFRAAAPPTRQHVCQPVQRALTYLMCCGRSLTQAQSNHPQPRLASQTSPKIGSHSASTCPIDQQLRMVLGRFVPLQASGQMTYWRLAY